VLENPEIDELIDWQNKSKTHGLGGFLLANPHKGKSLDNVTSSNLRIQLKLLHISSGNPKINLN
jgi:hypothetical protein